MSYHTLQQLTTRMLFDARFTDAVYADAERTLTGLDLTSNERTQLLAVDRRAWRTDALRVRRTLRTLAEEFKISTTIALAETRSLASLEAYFSSQFFHTAIQQRGSLALSFAEFLQDGYRAKRWTAPQLPDLIRLEATIVACRRKFESAGAKPPEPPGAVINDRARVALAPGCDVAGFQANVIATVQYVEKYLFELSLMPAMALCNDAPHLGELPPVASPDKTWLLFSPGAAGIDLTHVDKATFQVLSETRQPLAIKNLIAKPGATKASSRHTQATLSEWLENGALVIVD
jgi:hypothetical protein